MLEILRDSVWQSVGAVLAVIGIGTAFWIYYLQRQTKELAFGLLSSRRLLSIADELSSRVKVQLDGLEVKNLNLLVYALKNSGNKSICQSDFDRPLSINFPKGKVVSAEIAFQTPSNLGAAIKTTDSSIELQPLLLNSGDLVLVQVLLSAQSTEAEVDVRIIDVSSLASINTNPRLPPFMQSGTPFLIAVFLILAVGNYFLGDTSDQKNIVMLVGFTGVAAFAALHGLFIRLYQNMGAAGRRYVDEI